MIAPDADRRAAFAAAEALVRRDRDGGLAALADLFAAGRLPDPLPRGFCPGRFAAFALPSPAARTARALASRRLWLGKTFDPAHARGANHVSPGFLPLGRVLWPLYRGYTPVAPGAYRAFPFSTYPGFALLTPGLSVLKIDYDLPDNPRLVVRNVRDEIVQLAAGFYLGRWHFLWPGRRPQLVAYFVLEAELASPF